MRAAVEVYEFKIVLLEIAPPIWRTIQVPGTYSFWDQHRLSIVVAGMLRHAVAVAVARFGEDAPERSAAASLIRATEEDDPEQVADQIADLAERPFRDAKVPWRRANARGDEYSILDSSIQEFASWYAMPWD